MADIADLIKAAQEERPADFSDAFKSIMQNKVADVLDQQRDEVAQQFSFNNNDDESQDDDVDEIEYDEYYEDSETEEDQ